LETEIKVSTGDSSRADEEMRLINHIVLANVFWKTDQDAAVASILSSPQKEPILGQFALTLSDERCHYLIRDRIGLNKLFFHLNRDTGELTVGNFIRDVATATQDYGRIFAVPPAHYLRVDRPTQDIACIRYYDINDHVEKLPALEPEELRARVDATLSDLFSELSVKFGDARVFVCLSGGLDSTIIAAYARKFLRDPTAVTFSHATPQLNSPGVYTGESLHLINAADPLLSEDFWSAARIAGALKMPFAAVLCRKSLDRDLLRDVLIHGQDWRDFNVHCAWVNHEIGRSLRREYPDDSLVVVTGDLMNEFVADYQPVEYGGAVYYPQPNVPKHRLRRFFVYGLEAGDREIGIFHQFGIVTVQPYSALAELYLSVPGTMLERPDAKETLNLPLITDPQVQALVSRVKVRAQVGGKEGGTLALFHHQHMDQESLLSSWHAIFEPLTKGAMKDNLITTGRYRTMEVG
jgi:hypothetical protein